MGVSFQIPAQGMEDHDKTGSEIQGFILFPELFVNGKDTVAVGYVDKFKGHGGSALHGV